MAQLLEKKSCENDLNLATLISVIVFLIPYSTAYLADEAEVYQYIDTHKELAVIEMYRTGVPASITMARAIHESQVGKSDLARNANNHFGIKCKSYWKGMTYYHKDDDYNTRGDLIESCFRAYDTVFDSYVDHSNFLKYTKYYKGLFELDRQDYEAWARGLKKAGYATDPTYADKLIKVIEKYNLDVLDFHPDPTRKIKKQTSNN